MGEEGSWICYAIGKKPYRIAWFYELPVLPRTLKEFEERSGRSELPIFPRERLAEIVGISFQDIKSMPNGTWYKIRRDRTYRGQLLGSGRWDEEKGWGENEEKGD